MNTLLEAEHLTKVFAQRGKEPFKAAVSYTHLDVYKRQAKSYFSSRSGVILTALITVSRRPLSIPARRESQSDSVKSASAPSLSAIAFATSTSNPVSSPLSS